MQTDGSIEYSSYSLQELREALALIDKNKFPINFRNLQSEIASRPAPVTIIEAAPVESCSPWRRYQTFWRRILARLIDGLVLWPANWMLMSMSVSTDARSALPLIAWNAIWCSVWPLYRIFFVFQYGATIGKMVVGLRVVDLSEERRPLLQQAILREIDAVVLNGAMLAYLIVLVVANRYEGYGPYLKHIGAPIAFLFLGWLLAEFITMFSNPKRRALHDFIAGTMVVRRA